VRNFTPGPWDLVKAGSTLILKGPPPRPIITDWDLSDDEQLAIFSEEDWANAHLMSAAPELLKACELALEDFQSGHANISTYDALFSAISKAINFQPLPS